MAETNDAALSPSLTPSKTNPWFIIIVVIVILCCFCVGALGLLVAFGGPILNELGLLQALIIQP